MSQHNDPEDIDDFQSQIGAALQEFSEDESGGRECRRILNDWIVKLRERAGCDDELFRREIWEAVDVLREIQSAITPIGVDSKGEGNQRYAWPRLWVWPSEDAVITPPKHWIGRSPISVDHLDKAIAKYLKRPWLQHDIIDASVINALLFTALAEFAEQVRIGTATGTPNWSYILSGGNELAQLGWAVSLAIIGFLARWVILPAIAIGLIVFDLQTAAIVVFGLWGLYILYRILMIPTRWRLRKARRAASAKADEIIHAITHAWSASRGSTINPSTLKELVREAEGQGAIFRPVLHTLIDRAIQRDPTALVTVA